MSVGQSESPINLAREEAFALGVLEVRPPTRELIAEGRSQKIEPRVMQVLVALARRRGEVVSRDELIARCWLGRAVSEDAINRCIGSVRRLAEAHGGFHVHTVTRVGYRLDADELDVELGEERPKTLSAVVELRPEPLLAVLAFDNLSGDPEMSYFSDGVSEEILDTVGRGSGLKVIARSSSFQFRGADKAVKKVVADLKVTHLLDGSVRRSGSHVRIAARLVECASETVIWSDRYDRDLTDIFALQDEIAASVAAALETAFRRSGRQPGKLDSVAYDLFLRARDDSIFRPRSQRIEMLEQCVALAPAFADAWAWLACERGDHAKWDRGGDLPLAPLVEAARTALTNAELLDPTMGRTREAREALEPHAAYRRREVLLREAIRLCPGDPLCLASTADLLGEVGRCREALALAEEAKALDPLKGEPWAFSRWLSLLDYDQQAAQFDSLLAKWPANSNFSLVSAAYAAANADWPRYEALRRHAYAQPFAENSGVAEEMRQTFRYWDAVRDSDRAFLDDLAKRLLERVEQTGRAPLHRLWSASAAGYVDAAFQAVERAEYDGAYELGGPRVSAWWQGALFQRCFSGALIDDPRFLRLCGKLGLVHYWLDIGRWPDCADQVRYDFRAEARKVAADGLARHV
jgi:TolB-like protein